MNKKQTVNQNLLKAARQVPEQVQFIRLSKAQLNVLQNIQHNEQVTALTMAKRCATTVNAMSQLLRQLYDKNYLQRDSRVRECGGVEFVYFGSYN
ncbi:MAG: hypothetical protein CENE_03786 [Candidatus Celerinatantimonas neptuna]|nr:MAG: hypothetical protein CENE_03786 [Candidatus Celerinatantimonas neptuna]